MEIVILITSILLLLLAVALLVNTRNLLKAHAKELDKKPNVQVNEYQEAVISLPDGREIYNYDLKKSRKQ